MKRAVSLILVWIMVLGTATISANAETFSAEIYAYDRISDLADGAVNRAQPDSEPKAVQVLLFDNILYWFETTILKDRSVSNVKKLAYAAKTGGEWTLTKNITVNAEIQVRASEKVAINADNHSITRSNGGYQDQIFDVFGGSYLWIYRAKMNSKEGRCCLVKPNGKLEVDIGSTLESKGDGIVNEGYTKVEGGSAIKTTGSNSACIWNRSSGALEFWKMTSGYILNEGVLTMTKGRYQDIAKVTAKQGSMIKMEAGHIGTLYYYGSAANILTQTGGTIDTKTCLGYNLGDETYRFKNYSDTDSTGGHCFGMAVTSSGYFLGNLSKTAFGGNNAKTLYGYPDSAAIRKPICKYQNIQGSFRSKAIVAGKQTSSYTKELQRVNWNACVQYVKNHQHDGMGDLILSIQCADTKGHAMNFLYYREVKGQQRLYVYDNNVPEKEMYICKGSDDFYYLGTDAKGIDTEIYKEHGHIQGIVLIDIKKYFENAAQYNAALCVYADENEVTVEGAVKTRMIDGSSASYVMFEVPKDSTEVIVTPLVPNASFTYMDQVYAFTDVDCQTVEAAKDPQTNSRIGESMVFTIQSTE